MKKKDSLDNSTSFRKKVRGIFFSFFVARRYFFSKKSHNAVNVISGISSAGIGVGAMALICVMSVFNGIGSLVDDMFSAFDPDLKITAVEGKVFRLDSIDFQSLKEFSSVEIITEVVEESALLKFKEKQAPVMIKGVESQFQQMTQIDSLMFDGAFLLYDGAFDRIVPGIGVASLLGLNAHFVDPVFLYAPKRTAKVNLLHPENSFIRVSAFPSGVFMVQQPQYDDNCAFISIRLARELFEYDENTVTSLELKLKEGVDKDAVKREIQEILGDSFSVKNRYEQQETFFKIMTTEKWMTYLILCFILLIASFNIIGSLSMLIIEKKADILTLQSLGASNRLIKNIFLFEGWIISLFGALIGIVLGTVLCVLQQYFGFIKMGSGSFIDSYPIVTKPSDILIVFVTVLLLGLLAAYYPVSYINTKNKLLD